MDMQRAKEIFNTDAYIEVTYEGTPVHIERLFESSPFAEVQFDNGSTTNAPVEELHEQNH